MNFKKNSIVFLVVFMVTMMFSFVNAANEDKFMQLLTKEQELVEIAEDIGKNTAKAKQLKGQLSWDMTGLMDEEDKADVALKKFLVDFDLVKEGKNESMVFLLNLNDVDFAKGEVALSNKLIAVNVEELTDGMIAVNYKELDKLFEKFGMEEDFAELEKIMQEESQLSQKQTKKLLKIYEKVVKKIIKNKVELEKNVKITDNGNEYVTNKYTVSVDTKLAMDFIINVFDELKKDKTLYYQMIDNAIEGTGLTREEFIKDFDTELEEMKRMRKEIEKTDDKMYNEIILQISLYENNGKTLVTEIANEDIVMKLKAFRETNADIIEIEAKESNYGEEIHVRMTINQSKEKLDAVLRVYGKEVSVKYEFDENMNLITNTKEVDRDAEILKLNMVINKKADRKLKPINDKNTFVLNDKTIEEMDQKFKEIEANVPNFEDEVQNAFGEYIAMQEEEKKFNMFMNKIFSMESEFMDAYMDLFQENYNNNGKFISFNNFIVAIAIGEKDVDKIRDLKKENYVKNIADIYPEYELPERLKNKKLIKITNPEFTNPELGELYVDSDGYEIFLAKPYNFRGKLYISEYYEVTLKNN